MKIIRFNLQIYGEERFKKSLEDFCETIISNKKEGTLIFEIFITGFYQVKARFSQILNVIEKCGVSIGDCEFLIAKSIHEFRDIKYDGGLAYRFSKGEISELLSLDDYFFNKTHKHLKIKSLDSSPWEVEKIVQVNTQMDEFCKNIKSMNLTPFEEYMFIYTYLSQTMYAEAQPDKLMTSRNIIDCWNGKARVCVGYASLLKILCDGVGLDVAYVASLIPTQARGHAFNLVKMNDPKYAIQGIFVSDVTNDACFSKNGKTFSPRINHALLTFEDYKDSKTGKYLVGNDLTNKLIDLESDCLEQLSDDLNDIDKILDFRYKQACKEIEEAIPPMLSSYQTVLKKIAMKKQHLNDGDVKSILKRSSLFADSTFYNYKNRQDCFCKSSQDFLSDFTGLDKLLNKVYGVEKQG